MFKRRIKKYKGQTFAFEIEGKKFYFIENENEFMKFTRWEAVSRYRELYHLRFTHKNFYLFLNKIEEFTDSGQLGMIGYLTQEAKKRALHLTDVDAMYQFSAQYFFEEGEDLEKILSENEMYHRIKLFKKKEIREFIRLQPISNLLVLPELLKHFSEDALIMRMNLEKIMKSGLDKVIQGENL